MPQPIIDIHVHIIPHHMMKPAALELITRGRNDFAKSNATATDPKNFLRFLDRIGVERAGLINYVAPKSSALRRKSMIGSPATAKPIPIA